MDTAIINNKGRNLRIFLTVNGKKNSLFGVGFKMMMVVYDSHKCPDKGYYMVVDDI